MFWRKGNILMFHLSHLFALIVPGQVIYVTKKYCPIFFFALFYHPYTVLLAFCYNPAWHCGIFAILVTLHHSCVLQCSVQHHIRTTCMHIYLYMYLCIYLFIWVLQECPVFFFKEKKNDILIPQFCSFFFFFFLK